MVANQRIIIISAVVFFLWFVSMIFVFRKGKDTEPLLEARVPQETIDFFNEFLNSFDIKLIFNPNPSDEDWDNDRNFGEDEKTGLRKLEDEYFIVYFDNKLKEHERAVRILEYAHQAIPGLADLMGTYFYPSDANGRKLPIYLASDGENYTWIFQQLLNTNRKPDRNSVGLYISSYSTMGNVTMGILLHPRIWEIKKHPDYARRVLWHEMNHYVFFTSLKYDKVVKPFTWVYEGLAEYFSMPAITKLNKGEANLCQSLSLSEEFQNRYANYWAGQTVYHYFEDHHSVKNIKNFIKNSYEMPTNSALHGAFKNQAENLEREWHEYVYTLTK
jgi:hypothetical protein